MKTCDICGQEVDYYGCLGVMTGHHQAVVAQQLKLERDEAIKTINIIHKMLDNCNVPRESVVWNNGVQTVTEFPATERLTTLIQAWKDERENTTIKVLVD